MYDTLLDRPLGQLACEIPGATALFHRQRLDYCCGGHQTLREAALARGKDAQALAGELAALQQQPANQRDWREASTGELIDHLILRFHERHRAQLPELIRLARKVEAVHADVPHCPRGLADHLAAMRQDLEQHMDKEEQVLFPLLRQGGASYAAGPITMMRHEHDAHGESLARMVALGGANAAGELQAPAGACTTWRALIDGLRAFREDLTQHIHLENNVLFERAAREAQAEAAAGSCCGGGCGGR